MRKKLVKILTPNTKRGIDNLIELAKKEGHDKISDIRISFKGNRDILHWNNEDVTVTITLIGKYRLKSRGTGYRFAATLTVFSDIEAYYLDCLKYDFNQEEREVEFSFKEYNDEKYVLCENYREIDLALGK